jgi:hypothetical protein
MADYVLATMEGYPSKVHSNSRRRRRVDMTIRAMTWKRDLVVRCFVLRDLWGAETLLEGV